jgi:hypothetical protein
MLKKEAEGGNMSNLRSSLNPEEQPGAVAGPTGYRTGINQFELRCGMCGNLYFVDQPTAERVKTAIEQGLDDPFRCEDCEEEYDEMAYEG